MIPTLCLLASFLVTAAETAAPAPPNPLAAFDHRWEDAPTWNDGQAEAARYDATRLIYGKLRRYDAVAYTNKELADPKTKTKSATDQGREVFKHHLREDVPTENYDYHFSTMTYVGTNDFKSLKIDAGSIEDCGTTFKQFVNHAGRLDWFQASYFPDEGRKAGGYTPPAAFAYQDALFIVLRGYPFDIPPPAITLAIVPDQTSNRLTPADPVPMTITYEGRETLDLPIGKIDAHHLRVATATDGLAGQPHDYWFAADGNAPWLHALVKYTGPDAQTLALRSLERRAYWKRE